MHTDKAGNRKIMNLSKKQKQIISKKYRSTSTKKLADQLNINEEDVKSFIDTIKKPIPKWFYLLFILIPILFFILLETGLRIFNYGRDDRVWIDISKDMQIVNPEVSYRYFFTTKNVPFSVESFVYKEKKDNSFSVFFLGASSGAGYPYLSSASMSKFIRKKLEIMYPEVPIEVVNISMSAINSYTILDLLPDILNKKPDLILIYLGHNEYYGALGVGSLETLGSSRILVNTILWLNKFKTVELLRKIINSISGFFSSEKVAGGTLMAQMAQNKLIEYKGDTFWNGINQFKGNLRDIFNLCKEKNVPVIASTLVSNLKDQKPFISVTDSKNPSAKNIFSKARMELQNGDLSSAESLFVYAKELDALRFRAPEDINKVIRKLCGEFGYPVISSDSLFNKSTPDGIPGNNLFTDHLHPNVKGYQLLGNLFFNAMKKYNYLPKAESDLSEEIVDSLVYAYYNFTVMDSTEADFRIKILKNDWPYIDPKNKIPRSQLIQLNNLIDSVAINVIDGRTSREQARLKVASYYLLRNKYESYGTEMAALVEEFPFLYKYYDLTAKELLKAEKFSNAFYFLNKGFNKNPNAFNSKWLGMVDLSQGFIDDAIVYLETSLNFDNRDSQTYYNLTGAYAQKKEFDKALKSIDKCLQLNPGFPRANIIKKQLESIINKKNAVE